jgi:hypothetical protein
MLTIYPSTVDPWSLGVDDQVICTSVPTNVVVAVDNCAGTAAAVIVVLAENDPVPN